MIKTFKATYDGQVLRPAEPLDIIVGAECEASVDVPATETDSEEDMWSFLKRMEGSVELPTDFSEQHDHYLYGARKQPLIRPVHCLDLEQC
jgi:hypothetical protein